MIDDDRARFEILLEQIEQEVRTIARGLDTLANHFMLTEIVLDRLEHRLDLVERQAAVHDATLGVLDAPGALDMLDACPAGAQPWIEWLAQHLGLDEAPDREQRPRRRAGKRKPRKADRAAGAPSQARRRARAK